MSLSAPTLARWSRPSPAPARRDHEGLVVGGGRGGGGGRPLTVGTTWSLRASAGSEVGTSRGDGQHVGGLPVGRSGRRSSQLDGVRVRRAHVPRELPKPEGKVWLRAVGGRAAHPMLLVSTCSGPTGLGEQTLVAARRSGNIVGRRGGPRRPRQSAPHVQSADGGSAATVLASQQRHLSPIRHLQLCQEGGDVVGDRLGADAAPLGMALLPRPSARQLRICCSRSVSVRSSTGRG